MLSWSFNSTQTITLPKDVGIEISGLYNSPSSYALARSRSRSQLNFAIQKKVLTKKGLIKLAFNDIFWSFQYGGETTLGTTHVTNNYKWDNRTVMLSFTYKFGNPLMKSE